MVDLLLWQWLQKECGCYYTNGCQTKQKGKKMDLIIAGGRYFNDYKLLSWKVEKLCGGKTISKIISGGARGADSLGEKYAVEKGIPIERFIPDWDGDGKKAGMLRNLDMADCATHLIAFWDGKSKGTLHMIKEMKRLGKPVRVVKYE